MNGDQNVVAEVSPFAATVRALLEHVYKGSPEYVEGAMPDFVEAAAESGSRRYTVLRFMPNLSRLGDLPGIDAIGTAPLVLSTAIAITDMVDEVILHNLGVFHGDRALLLQIRHDSSNTFDGSESNAEWRLTDYGADRIALLEKLKGCWMLRLQMYEKTLFEANNGLHQVNRVLLGLEAISSMEATAEEAALWL